MYLTGFEVKNSKLEWLVKNSKLEWLVDSFKGRYHLLMEEIHNQSVYTTGTTPVHPLHGKTDVPG